MTEDLQITSDYGRMFSLVWVNQGALDPRGLTGWIDVANGITWVLFPSKSFPFFKISFWFMTDG